MEQSLIPVIQFKDCLKNKEKDVVNDNNMLEFILSRLETIENCWAALWLNKKIQYNLQIFLNQSKINCLLKSL